MPKEKIGRKLKSKRLADIQCETQKMYNVLKLMGHKTVISKKKYVTYSNKDIMVRVATSINNMSNIKPHPSTVWTLRTKMKVLEKIKNGEVE